MTPIIRPECPQFLLPFLADDRSQWEKLYGSYSLNNQDHRFRNDFVRRYRERLVEELLNVFGPVCCYCESYAQPGIGVVDRFRPRRSVRGEPHYAHLQADWRNLYWACPMCNRYKSQRFPQLGHMLPDAPYWETVAAEEPGLLDPCHDDPDQHLRFDSSGLVFPISLRGKLTIEILDLNRRQLVQTRHEQAELMLAGRTDFTGEYSHRAHGAVRRQLAAERHPTTVFRPFSSPVTDEREQAATGYDTDESTDLIDTETGDGMDSYLEKAQYVTRLQIENFGPIHQLDLNLEANDSSSAPCYALLGENGVGKSTVLRALALTLSGEAYTTGLKIRSNTILAHKAHNGSVVATLVGGAKVTMSFTRNKKIQFSNAHSRSLVVAYGATRLLATPRHKAKPGRAHAKIDNLFDPFLPITNPSEWLLARTADQLAEVNNVLLKLMPKDHGVQVRISEGKVSLEVGGIPERQLHQLSDGYQCMIGMAVDIMQVLSQSGAALDSAEGIVLIDELGNHFHPEWRLRCLPAMREAFPGAQIIYSTHDPLCLRGLNEGEVAVLRRDKLSHIYALENLPAVAKLRVDQLLRSEHFGMKSTVDPELEAMIEEYEALRILSDRTPGQEQRLGELITQLTDNRYLGGSRRERMALQMLDTTGAAEIPVDAAANVQQFTEATVSKLRLLMQRVNPAFDTAEGA